MKSLIPDFVYEDHQDPIAAEKKGSEHMIPLELSVIEGDGIFVRIEGAQFLCRYYTSTETMFKVNVVKKTIIEFLRLFYLPQFMLCIPAIILFPKRKFISTLIEQFNRIAMGAIGREILKPQYMNPCAREIRLILSDFLMGIGVNEESAGIFSKCASHIVEYDPVYMQRIIDLGSETTKEKLLAGLRSEIKRLGKICEAREVDRMVRKKMRLLFFIARVILLDPRIKRSLLNAIDVSDWSRLQYSEKDRYWAMQKEEYNFTGKTLDERIETLKKEGYVLPKKYSTEEIIKLSTGGK